MIIPCKDCLILPICTHKKVIKCSILLRFLNKAKLKLGQPYWGNMLDDMRKVLKGNWCAVGINNKYIKVEKDYKSK